MSLSATALNGSSFSAFKCVLTGKIAERFNEFKTSFSLSVLYKNLLEYFDLLEI